MSAFAWVIDDGCAPLAAAGGAEALAVALAGGVAAPAHGQACPACALLGGSACAGALPLPIAAAAESWLIDRLPTELESPAGALLRQALADTGCRGEAGAALRAQGLAERREPVARSWGPFFRRYTVTSDQLLEQLLLAGDPIAPTHGLSLLVELEGVALDGQLVTLPAHGAALAELAARPEARRARLGCLIAEEAGDPAGVAAIKRLLRGLYAACVLDAPTRLFT